MAATLQANILYCAGVPQVLFQYCAEEVASARHTALFQRFIKASLLLPACCVQRFFASSA